MNKHVKTGLICLGIVAVTTATLPQRSRAQAVALKADNVGKGILEQAQEELADAMAKVRKANKKIQQALDEINSQVADGFVDYDFYSEYEGNSSEISYLAPGTADRSCNAAGMTDKSHTDSDKRLRALQLAKAAAKSNCSIKFGWECKVSDQLRFVNWGMAKCRIFATAAPGANSPKP